MDETFRVTEAEGLNSLSQGEHVGGMSALQLDPHHANHSLYYLTSVLMVAL